LADAKAVCESEGSYLAVIPTQDVHNNLTALIKKKKIKYEHYNFVDYYWLGAKPITDTSDWEWLSSARNMEKSFSKWKTNVKSK
jgi:hypothetical protein